jgi:UDP-N-acetylmuramyl pentapeptide synthase
MGEVGTQGPGFHAEVGAHAKARGITHIWLAGEACLHALAAIGTSGAGVRHFDDAATLAARVAEGPAAASVLVKGSRFMRMEQAVAALKELAE